MRISLHLLLAHLKAFQRLTTNETSDDMYLKNSKKRYILHYKIIVFTILV